MREKIRKSSWTLLVLWLLANILLIGLSQFLGTSTNLFSSLEFYISNLVAVISLIGLFLFKKWGFYLYVLYVAYLSISNIIYLNIVGLIIVLVLYGYLIGYKGFYENILDFE